MILTAVRTCAANTNSCWKWFLSLKATSFSGTNISICQCVLNDIDVFDPVGENKKRLLSSREKEKERAGEEVS